MLMPTQSSNFDDRYNEICSRLSKQEESDFVYSLVGLMSGFLDEATTEYCLEKAETFVATDLTARLLDS